MKVSLSIRLALSKILSRRSGKKFGVLIIDELSDLDEDGMTNFVKMINIVSKDFNQIFFVSHIDTLKDCFNQTIQVVKCNGESRIV